MSNQLDLFNNNMTQTTYTYNPTVTTTISSNTSPGLTINYPAGPLGGGYFSGNMPGTAVPLTDYGNLTIGVSNQKAPLHVKGDAEFEGEIKIKGKSLTETLNKIEERLAILHPIEQLEAKWEKLKELGDAYRKLEAEILEKEFIWDQLKR